MSDKTPDMLPDLPPDEALALDWALGALDARAHAAAEARRLADPAFAALCRQWAENLAPLADDVAPVAPSADLWSRIDTAIGAEGRVAAPVTTAAAAPVSLWNRLGLWRGATAAFAAVAAALLVSRPPVPVPAPAPAPTPAPTPAAPAMLAATLTSEGGAPLVTAALDPSRHAVVLSPVSAAELQGRVPELWLIPADGKPRSLGLINLGGAQRVEVSATNLQLVAEGAILAVSLEPVGGSPTGLPTGPVVATGKLASI